MRHLHTSVHSSIAHLDQVSIIKRDAARAIVVSGEDILLLYTERYHDYTLPGGGIDSGEDKLAALVRELEEETGVAPDLVTVEAETTDWVTYDLPPDLIGKLWKGRWRGQTQKWFLFRFNGADNLIDLTKHDQEFARWRWSTPTEVVENIVPFKRTVYEQVLQGFAADLS